MVPRGATEREAARWRYLLCEQDGDVAVFLVGLRAQRCQAQQEEEQCCLPDEELPVVGCTQKCFVTLKNLYFKKVPVSVPRWSGSVPRCQSLGEEQKWCPHSSGRELPVLQLPAVLRLQPTRDTRAKEQFLTGLELGTGFGFLMVRKGCCSFSSLLPSLHHWAIKGLDFPSLCPCPTTARQLPPAFSGMLQDWDCHHFLCLTKAITAESVSNYHPASCCHNCTFGVSRTCPNTALHLLPKRKQDTTPAAVLLPVTGTLGEA